MARETFLKETFVKRGDTGTPVEAILRDGDGDPVDLSGAAVRFVARDAIHPRALRVAAAATIVDAAAGSVRYDWSAEDTRRRCVLQAEFEVVFGTGEIVTFPNDSYLRVTILDDVDLP